MLKIFLKILNYYKTGATIFTYKIHKVNTPYAGLEGL